MYKAFEIIGYKKADVDKSFNALITAFKYGAPPHGGLAPGIDRMVMLLADEKNIREVSAFPFNQQAEDIMIKTPANISKKHINELLLMGKRNQMLHLPLQLPGPLKQQLLSNLLWLAIPFLK